MKMKLKLLQNSKTRVGFVIKMVNLMLVYEGDIQNVHR